MRLYRVVAPGTAPTAPASGSASLPRSAGLLLPSHIHVGCPGATIAASAARARRLPDSRPCDRGARLPIRCHAATACRSLGRCVLKHTRALFRMTNLASVCECEKRLHLCFMLWAGAPTQVTGRRRQLGPRGKSCLHCQLSGAVLCIPFASSHINGSRSRLRPRGSHSATARVGFIMYRITCALPVALQGCQASCVRHG